MSKFSIAVSCILAAGTLAAVAGDAAAQQTYPSKPIRLILPYAPGGATSALGYLIGPKITEGWAQQVIVDHRPGGNTIIGAEAAAKSPPDGYTIVLVTSSHVIVPLLLRAPYDPIKDFAAVATVVSTEFVLVLHPSVPAKSVQELIALAQSRPGQLNYASSSSGGMTHLAGELFNMMAGVRTQHIPYKGGGPAITDLLGGQVQMYFVSPAAAIPYIKSGKLRAIAVSGESRLSAMPQVPTFNEAHLPRFDVKNWFGILAPAGTPKAIIDKLSTEIAKILAMPDIREKIVSQGLDPFISSPERFAGLMKADMAKWGKVIDTANIKFDQ